MRWLIACLLVLCAGSADAKRLVILEPPMVRKCPKAKTFALVQQCLKKHGTVVVKRSLGNARLVSVGMSLYLYVERNGQWHIAGTFESWAEYSLLGFEYQKVGKHTGYRIDIGQAMPTNVMLDDVTVAPAVMRTYKSLYCSGANYDCIEAIRTCEVYVAGQPRFVFRGTFELDLQSVNIKGDRSRGGPVCSPPPKVYLGWPSQP